MHFQALCDADDIGLGATHLNASFREIQELRERVCDFLNRDASRIPASQVSQW